MPWTVSKCLLGQYMWLQINNVLIYLVNSVLLALYNSMSV